MRFLVSCALLLGLSYQSPEPAAAADPVPESATNRKIRQMNKMRDERRQAADDDGAYSNYSTPDTGEPVQRGYYSSRSGYSPSNPGGNAFGDQSGAAYPSDGGQAYPIIPANR